MLKWMLQALERLMEPQDEEVSLGYNLEVLGESEEAAFFSSSLTR